MSVKPVASYWSATAQIGREPPAPSSHKAIAGYWSATADIGRTDKVSLSNSLVEATFVNRRAIPYVTNRGEAGSAYRTQQTIADLDKYKTTSPLSKKLSIGDDRALSNQEAFFTRLTNNLSNLSARLKELSTIGAFNPNSVSSSDSSAVSVGPSFPAAEGVYEVSVERLAQSHQVASDTQSDPYAELNLSGTISVNGYSITISTTDTLADIRDYINRGEDANENGLLEDESEDLNSNGTLDHYYQSSVYIGNGQYLPSFNYYEDIDADGEIDTSEDLNGNELLDGGVKDIKAKASIEDGRLIITSLDGADKKLILSDPDDILESLGIFKRGTHNEKILKTSLDNDEYEDIEYIKDPQTAQFTINGISYTAYDNRVENVIPGVIMTLNSTTDNSLKIKVSKDVDPALNRIEAFSLSFNSVISDINDQNIGHLQIQENVRVQDFVIALARSAHGQVESITRPPSSLDDLGIQLSGSARTSIDVAAIEGLESSNGYKGLINTGGGEPGLFSRLSRIGIQSRDDFTLDIDRHKLSEQIEKNPEQVYAVFNNSPDGVGYRLERDINYALGQPNGMIEYQNQVIRSYRSSPSDANLIISKQAATTYQNTRTQTDVSIFDSLTV